MPALPRRAWIALAASALLSACAGLGPGRTDAQPPIVFVHGNGDSAATWQTTLWRWESQGWPRARLHAVNFANPLARDDDTQAQAGRSGTAEQRDFLAAEVDRVLAATGARQVVLMANSRGGNAIRHCIQSGGCAGKVSHAILGGTPNHGVWANPGFRPNNEFNGAGPFLTALNAPKGPDGQLLPAGAVGVEVTPGLRWMTIRSDNNDKFAQPDGLWIGAKGTPTNVTAEGPALRGADNVVLPGRDHREVSYHAEAFAQAWRFVTGRAPASTAVQPEERVLLDGLATGITAGSPSNQPAPGARVSVYAVDAATGARLGAPLLDKTVAADGRWGPLATDARTALEFVLAVPGLATTHVYRAPFARSSAVVHLRPERLLPADAQAAAAVVNLSRPRGYFGLPRDVVLLDGAPAPGIAPGVAGVSSSKKLLAEPDRPVVAEFRSGPIAERIVGRGWPAKEGHVTLIELHE
ncbi:twin-arginine translocation pathway signal [Aquabacterium sp. OR-4]|uniref:twin-arginine translocation pathway signal n=1 Tax=Aquabacterium sp. OR-4 TaxID=2978127 RepID=UPI0021B34ED6|nr:twin-arginine translocation pathway signal [Aquabacterium sp. OR-4]MDT7837377.1 twin-arginine translocation pathway signal [Aquabacterium sp. OR-4]